MKVGFIGLGAMGQGMAKNLLAAGHELSIYNRTKEKAEALGAAGARVAETPAEAARGAEAVFSMLAEDSAVEKVVFAENGLLAGLARGAVHISSSTISVALSERLVAAHAAAGQGYVAAPVFGRPEAAAAKQLWVVAAGPRAEVDRVRPLLEAIGRGLRVVGEEPTAANVVKLAGNFVIASSIEAFGEAYAFARKQGVSPPDLQAVLMELFGGSAVLARYVELIASEAYEPAGFKVELGLKDMRLVLAAADASTTPMPLASLLRDNYLAATAQGRGDLDWSALGLFAAERAGLRGRR
ncbi:NAD(P)-dependent oxidoreductase [Polyangium sp. 6x1]|uniref:NAD(P)-dependent oxidoreductase n=1 Tax=Polyangium sp. 6x1 TaxID=3042689 RepID=UPI002482AB3A|nr:NAD(P)-dependent oxidoreductase [Polyangium sp. 6x1]MDI1449387.1 NAD(P)-dependent oxidoreductase [Polyangium sp. 6x1]